MQSPSQVITSQPVTTKVASNVPRPRDSSALIELKQYLEENPELLKMSGAKASKWLLENKKFKVTPQYINKAKRQLK